MSAWNCGPTRGAEDEAEDDDGRAEEADKCGTKGWAELLGWKRECWCWC